LPELLNRLLDLDTLRLGEEAVRFGFERPLPPWGWALVGLAASAIAFWSYWRLIGARWGRTLLATTRAMLLVLLAVLIAGPRLVRQTESVERDWLLVLADRSLSMTIADTRDAQSAARITRDQQLRNALRATGDMWRELATDRTVMWLGFDAGVYDLAASEPGDAPSDDAGTPELKAAAVPQLSAPIGKRTALGAALDQALARAAARPLSAIVVFSDGRSIDEPTRGAMRRLVADRVPVHTVPLGSPEPLGDLGVRRVDAPQLAFVNDIAPVVVDLERSGGSGSALSAKVRLIDSETGAVLDEKPVEFPAGEGGDSAAQPAAQTVVLTHRPTAAGVSRWTVQIVSDAPDLIAANDSTEVTIELTDRPMRVLYIDGYPRWEQRYLRNLLIREQSITCSTLILAPDRKFTQEGDVELEALPDTLEGWREFDAVILGDVHPDVFTPDQLTQMRDHVALHGAGLVWIGGPGPTPSQWWSTPLADLIPFSKSAYDGSPLTEPAVLIPAPAAERLGVLRLSDDPDHPWPAELSDFETGWSQLNYAQYINPAEIKPTAEVIAKVKPLFAPEESPILFSMRFGAGRSLYLGTDEIWRWRYARGEILPERFWLQLIRMLGRESLARSGKSAVLTASPVRAVADQPVRIAVELLDQSLVEMRLPSISARVVRRPDPLEPDAERLSADLTLRPESPDMRTYSAVWIADAEGVWDVQITESALDAAALETSLDVALPDDELRTPETNHALLAAISEQTGGRVFQPSELDTLPNHLPNRQVRLLNEVGEPLWDTPLALILIVFLLTAEWIGRRVIRLI